MELKCYNYYLPCHRLQIFNFTVKIIGKKLFVHGRKMFQH